MYPDRQALLVNQAMIASMVQPGQVWMLPDGHRYDNAERREEYRLSFRMVAHLITRWDKMTGKYEHVALEGWNLDRAMWSPPELFAVHGSFGGVVTHQASSAWLSNLTESAGRALIVNDSVYIRVAREIVNQQRIYSHNWDRLTAQERSKVAGQGGEDE